MIHPTAILGKDVEIGEDTQIGPYCIIEDGVKLGSNNRLISHIHVAKFTAMGNDNSVFPFTTIGFQPQDLKFKDEETQCVIGNNNMIREHVTIHRGTGHGGGLTQIGNNNLLMVGSHVAHDCFVGNHTILSHACALAGHVTVGHHATVGAHSAVHQFCHVGDYAFIGGFSVITQDALPYVKSVGNRAKIYGINKVGLERKGFSKQELEDLRKAYRILFQKGLRLVEALAQLKVDFPESERVKYLVSFIEKAVESRGIVR